MDIKAFFLQFIKFGLVGFSSTLVSYGVYSLLIFGGLPYLIANIVGFIIGTLNSFLWNSIFVFKKQDSEKRNPYLVLIKTFLTYGTTNLVLSSFILFILVEKIYCSKYAAPIFVLFITVPLNFLINKFWAYRVSRKDLNHE